MLIKEKELKKFFNLSYGEEAPSREEWESLYNQQVKFIDPTQEINGIVAYIKAQDGLIKRCDDIYLESHSIAINKNIAFVEWTMGLKIKGLEFLYDGTTRLIFDEEGKVKEIEIILILKLIQDLTIHGIKQLFMNYMLVDSLKILIQILAKARKVLL